MSLRRTPSRAPPPPERADGKALEKALFGNIFYKSVSVSAPCMGEEKVTYTVVLLKLKNVNIDSQSGQNYSPEETNGFYRLLKFLKREKDAPFFLASYTCVDDKFFLRIFPLYKPNPLMSNTVLTKGFHDPVYFIESTALVDFGPYLPAKREYMQHHDWQSEAASVTNNYIKSKNDYERDNKDNRHDSAIKTFSDAAKSLLTKFKITDASFATNEEKEIIKLGFVYKKYKDREELENYFGLRASLGVRPLVVSLATETEMAFYQQGRMLPDHSHMSYHPDAAPLVINKEALYQLLEVKSIILTGNSVVKSPSTNTSDNIPKHDYELTRDERKYWYSDYNDADEACDVESVHSSDESDASDSLVNYR